MGIKHKKIKGKVLENKVQDILRKYFNVDDRIIKRNVSSGTQNGENGDINIVDKNIEKIFPYIIECKNQELWDFRDLIGNNINKKSNPFIKYWQQIEKETSYYNSKYSKYKYGLLIFSKQNYPIYVMGKYNNFSINFLSKVELVPHLITIINDIKYIILEFEIFLNILGQNEKV